MYHILTWLFFFNRMFAPSCVSNSPWSTKHRTCKSTLIRGRLGFVHLRIERPFQSSNTSLTGSSHFSVNGNTAKFPILPRNLNFTELLKYGIFKAVIYLHSSDGLSTSACCDTVHHKNFRNKTSCRGDNRKNVRSLKSGLIFYWDEYTDLNYPTWVPTFPDWQNSMIFPGIFSLYLKYDFQLVLNINMQPLLSFIWTKI